MVARLTLTQLVYVQIIVFLPFQIQNQKSFSKLKIKFRIENENRKLKLKKGVIMTQVIKKPNSRITYYVNEEKGVVIAKLKKWDMVTDTNLYLLNNNLPMIEPRFTYNKYYDGYFVGKATCSKDDSFDLEAGMRIARNRALQKYYDEKY